MVIGILINGLGISSLKYSWLLINREQLNQVAAYSGTQVFLLQQIYLLF